MNLANDYEASIGCICGRVCTDGTKYGKASRSVHMPNRGPLDTRKFRPMNSRNTLAANSNHSCFNRKLFDYVRGVCKIPCTEHATTSHTQILNVHHDLVVTYIYHYHSVWSDLLHYLPIKFSRCNCPSDAAKEHRGARWVTPKIVHDFPDNYYSVSPFIPHEHKGL